MWERRGVALPSEQEWGRVILCCLGQRLVGHAWELGEGREVVPRGQQVVWLVG